MQIKSDIEYPAFVYKKNNVFVANCLILNLISVGETEIAAINNLEKTITLLLKDFNIFIKPIYEDLKSVIK